MNLDELMQNVKPTLGPFADTLGPKLIMIVGLVWIFLGRPLESGAAWPWLASGVALLALAWCIPVVVVTATEVRLVRRFTTIRWVDVTMVFQPAPGDPIRIRRSDGKLFVLPGVGLDRLPEILALATQDSAEPRA